LKRIIIVTKRPRKKIRNQNNNDKIGKHNIINLDLKMKFKTNKTFTKESRKKNKNKKNNDQI
jgi:hypothetical protein